MDSDFESCSESDTESYCDSMSEDSYDGSERFHGHEEKIDISNWTLFRRSLKTQCAVQFVLHGSVSQLSLHEMPANLYPTLLSEACRARRADMVIHIVSEWPFPVLNLNAMEVPLEHMGTYFTKPWANESLSLAGMFCKGLLQLSPNSRLQRVVLLDSECEGSEIMRVFSRLPLFSLSHLNRKHIVKMINKQLKVDLDVAYYLQSQPMLPQGVAKPFKRTEPLVIVMPGVIQWMGKHCNYRDVVVGLALQAYVPIQFCFEKLVFYNALDLGVVKRIMELCVMPEKTKKLIINNRKRAEAAHILLKMAALHEELQRFPRIESFLCKFDGMYTTGVDGAHLSLALERSAACFSSWKYLRDINFSGNFLGTRLEQLLTGLEMPLIKLNLSATGLTEKDFKFLSESKHVESLQYLNLDNIDLSKTFNFARVKVLFQRLKSLVYLRTCCTGLTYPIAVSFAENLQHLDSLTHWNLLQNHLGLFEELVRFIKTVSKIKNLKELGCKPFELHALFASLYIQSVGPPALTDAERIELATVAERYGICVY